MVVCGNGCMSVRLYNGRDEGAGVGVVRLCNERDKGERPDRLMHCTRARNAPETMVFPSDVKSPQVTGPSWPVKTCTQSPVAASHIQMVQSLEPAIRTLPGL